MPDKKLTDSEIVKALKCLLELVLVEGCLQRAKTISNALDLINRLQAENKRLSTLAELGNKRANDYRVMRDRALKAEAEVERLEKENIALNRRAIPASGTILKVGNALLFAENKEDYGVTINTIKAEAYKEFADKLCDGRVSNDNTVILAKCLLKELVGEDK